MGAFVRAMDRLRARLGCAVIAVHHLGKDHSRGARGHSLLRCAVDTEITVEKRDGASVATVTKQRDMMAGQEIAFLLRQVELGLDQDDDPVTSCVVESTDFVPTPRARGPTGQAKAALDVLRGIIDAAGGELLPINGIEVRAVKVDAWRDALARNGRFGEDRSGQFRTAWSRIRRELADGGHVAFGEGFVWPTEEDISF
jgi:hypothetical protein